VAARVAGALGLALGAGERERLAERPTENFAAYDAFLRGEQVSDRLSTQDPVALQRAVEYYERAVALDSTFALAWAQLSRAYSDVYGATSPTAGAAAARHAAERALVLAPERPEGHIALGAYYGNVLYDLRPAQEHYTKARLLAPNDALGLSALAGNAMALGRTEEALGLLREAEMLDPRSVETATFAVYALTRLRRYDEALAAAERASALAPANLSVIGAKTIIYLAKGDLVGARAVLKDVPRDVDPAALVAYIAVFDDLYWVLDDVQQRILLRLSPERFGGDRAGWGLALAETHAQLGDSVRARAYADSARLAIQARLREVPQESWSHVYLGLAFAYMGRDKDAVREGERGVSLLPVSGNPGQRADLQRVLAWTYVLVGAPEKALNALESLLKVPSYWVSPDWLKIDPTFAPLRGNPRFERLVNGS
jgi:eukaryotic-like serine/threonine-protein kinase